MDVWSWICELPESPEFTKSDSQAVFQLASPPPTQDESTHSIQLRAERVSGSDPEAPTVTFRVILEGFQRLTSPATIWVSETCPLSSEKPFLPLVLQLLRELVALSPTNRSTCPRSQLREIKPDPVDWVMDSHSPESFSSLFNLIFLTRLFWLCVCDAPSEVGSFFFQHLLGPNVESMTCQHAPVLRTFLVSVGVDAELCITRAVSYAMAKWLIYKEIGVGVGVGLQGLGPLPRQQLGFCYATEAHGLWVLKGYIPISGMKTTNTNDIHKIKFPIVEPKAAVLRYALSHQHAEAVIQLEYSVKFHDSYIRVNTRVDNIRIHVAKLGLHSGEEIMTDFSDERYFPSRVRVWIGPEVGSTYVAGLSLGRSTNNDEREVELTRTLKGNFGKVKVPNVKARARMSTRKKLKDWRCEQDSDGNAAVFDAILYDRETGEEVITMKRSNNDDDHYNHNRNHNHNNNNNNGFKNRYVGVNRGFSKNGGVVFCGDEYGEEVGWRVGREMEGSVLKWRIGGQVWLSYWPNKLNSSFYETRCVEWCDEVDLPLVPTKLDNE